jgi:hypothetical protein
MTQVTSKCDHNHMRCIWRRRGAASSPSTRSFGAFAANGIIATLITDDSSAYSGAHQTTESVRSDYLQISIDNVEWNTKATCLPVGQQQQRCGKLVASDRKRETWKDDVQELGV